MRETVRGLAFATIFALALAACSSSGATPSAEQGAEGEPESSSACADAADLTGPIEDRGTEEASGGAITLDASDFAFSPTCVEAGSGGTLEVTVANGGSALHNLSVDPLGIDEDVPAGETITVELTLPDSGPVPFVCKYHIANGMQGAFLTG
jgi:plastocyanin